MVQRPWVQLKKNQTDRPVGTRDVTLFQVKVQGCHALGVWILVFPKCACLAAGLSVETAVLIVILRPGHLEGADVRAGFVSGLLTV